MRTPQKQILISIFMLSLNACGFSSFTNTCLLNCSSSSAIQQTGAIINPNIPAIANIPNLVNGSTGNSSASNLYTVVGPQTYFDGNGVAARFSAPMGVAKDSAGNLFVVDSGNSVIRKIDTSGNVTLFAGIPEGADEVDSAPGVPAQFDGPSGIAIDVNDNVYVTDQSGPTVRKISPSGVVTTLAGTAGNSGSVDGPGVNALFSAPYGIAVDPNGNVFVSDQGNETIREITPLGVVTTIAGTVGVSGSSDGNGTAASFYSPDFLAIDANGNIFVSDFSNETIREISPTYDVTTFAGTVGNPGSSDGLGTAASFSGPNGLVFDSNGNLLVADSVNATIRKIDPTGNVTTLAGNVSVLGNLDGAGLSAQFTNPLGLVFDGSGNLVVTDFQAETIRKIDSSANVTTFAGALPESNPASPAYNSLYTGPVFGMALDSVGNLFVGAGPTIQKITPQGAITVFAGGAVGYADGIGTAASFGRLISSIVIDGNDTLYVADYLNCLIRRITSAGVVTTLAGTQHTHANVLITNIGGHHAPPPPNRHFDLDATGTQADFVSLGWLAIDASANMYVSEFIGHTIRKVTPTGVVTTLAGSGTAGYVDAVGTNAKFGTPSGIVADSQANLFVVDVSNHVIRKITPAGVVSTFAGDGSSNILDGTGTAAEFGQLFAITIDSGDNLYVTESTGAIRKITPAAVVTTLVGTGNSDQSVDGPSTISEVGQPVAIVVDANGNLIFSDEDENSIRGFTSTLSPSVVLPRTVPTPFVTPTPIPVPVPGQISILSTLAGNSTFLNAVGTNARLNHPNFLATDSAGNIYISEAGNHDIRKVATDGTVTLFAGSPGELGYADGTGAAAMFNDPGALAFDANGNLFVADTGNSLIREISPAGVVTTFAGTSGNSGIQDGQGSAASFTSPYGLAFDANGNLFVSDSDAETIREIDPTGVVTTFAGVGNAGGTTDGQGANALFSTPSGIAFDVNGNLWVADQGNCLIREIDPSANVTTIAGGYNTCVATVDGNARNAIFVQPTALAFDANGNLFISDANASVIREMDTSFNVTTFAGQSTVLGSHDDTGTLATFYSPTGITFLNGNLLVADFGSDLIRSITNPGAVTSTLVGTALIHDRHSTPIGGMVMDSQGNTFFTENDQVMKMTPSGTVTSFAGTTPNPQAGSSDGTGSNASFSSTLSGIGIDGNDTLYVADTGNHEIRKITSGAVVTTFAGNVSSPNTTDVDGTGNQAQFVDPEGVTVDSAGTVYVSETGTYVIRAITQTGVVTTLAGTSGDDGYVDDTGPAAEFESPGAMVTDSTGNLFVVDAANYVIRKVTPSGVVTTFAGTGLTPGFNDGPVDVARFTNPVGITIDGSNNLYVTSSVSATNGSIRKITPSGYVTTLLSDGLTSGAPSSIDGDDTVGQVGVPTWIEVDYSGNLVFVDTNENSIRQYTSLIIPPITSPKPASQPFTPPPTPTPTPVPTVVNYTSVTTLGGLATYLDAQGTTARFNQPTGVAYDSSGNLFIVDAANHVIRKMDTSGNVTLFAGSPGVMGSADGTGSAAQFAQPFGLVFDSSGNLFVTDTLNDTIREITPMGVVTTFAGSAGNNGTMDGNGVNATFSQPRGITIDRNDYLYVADETSCLIRQISPTADVVTWAGSLVDGNITGTPDDGAYTSAAFGTLFGLFMTSHGNILEIADYGKGVLRIAAGGNVSTFIGDQSNFDGMVATVTDGSQNQFLLNYDGSTVFEISSGGVNTLVTGQDSTYGSTDGNSATALFNHPYGISLDPSGNLMVADTNNNAIRQIDGGSFATTTLVGAAPITSPGVSDVDGNGNLSAFGAVMGVVVDSTGNIFATTSGNVIRKITPAGVVTTFAGDPTRVGFADGTGSAATFHTPIGLAIDASDNLYVADSKNYTIRKITPLAVVTTIAGRHVHTGHADNANPLLATFSTTLTGISVDSNGNLFISDSGNNSIREFTTTGGVTTFAGGTLGTSDGVGTAAQFNQPYGSVFDGSGNLLVCDSSNGSIRKIAPDGTVSTLAGANSPWDGNDGYVYTVWTPVGITMDAAGSFEIAVVRTTGGATLGAIDRIDATGAITTLVGTPLATTPQLLLQNRLSAGVDGIGATSTTTDGALTIAQVLPAAITTDHNGNVIFGNIIPNLGGSVRALLK
jgi:sugar lactone lactonase YvrE